MKMKLLTLNYQRNGIGGEGFYCAVVKNLKDTKGVFLITFDEKKENESEVNTSTCRCVMVEGDGVKNPFYLCWRGDSIGYDLQALLNELKTKHNVENWYELHTIYKNKATGSKLAVRYKAAAVNTI